ncbi:MAG: putative 4-hydroxybenzoate polyprenyltransferase, partial [Desulfobulbaceae bacterium]|nr:putative 4-hydroxybenzoate polyprenyltransferase [Desulfobulbaceae bacterium]
SCHDSGQWNQVKSLSLLTVTKPVMDVERRDELAGRGSIVDMEGYAVAEVCQRMNIPCELLKGVSDMADDSGKADIKKNIDEVSARLASLFIAGLRQENASGGQGETKSGLIAKLFAFIKFEHTVFSLPLLFSGAWLGSKGTMPELRVLFLVLLAGVGGRSLGMAMNRILDRKLDALNPRTVGRELPSGKLSLLQAYSVAVAGLVLYMLACSGLGRICLILSPIPLIPLIMYSILKRVTCLCHFGIGVCLALAPLGAYVAATGSLEFSTEIMLLSLFTFCWISGYDIIYALQDMDSDRENGVHSMPARLGNIGAQIVAAITHVIAGAALIWLWFLLGSGVLSLLALLTALAALCVGYLQSLPLSIRFFPTSAVAGIAGALIPLLGDVL